jgi:enoyl-CoA hydratase
MSSAGAEPLIIASKSASNTVAILQLNRPKALNALSSPLFEQLNIELAKADADDSVKAIVLTGGEKVFAAGADIKEMKDKSCEQLMLRQTLVTTDILQSPTPTRVTSLALGPRCPRSESRSLVPWQDMP